jgi:hypothetical protein
MNDEIITKEFEIKAIGELVQNTIQSGRINELFQFGVDSVWVIKVNGQQVQLYSPTRPYQLEFFPIEQEAKTSLLNHIKWSKEFKDLYLKSKSTLTRAVWAKEMRKRLLETGYVIIERIR